MISKEWWPPAVIARSIELQISHNRRECEFNPNKEIQLILIPGMGAPVWQLFPLVNSIKDDSSFGDYGITAVRMGMSLGSFEEVAAFLEHEIKTKLLSFGKAKKLIFFGHSHGGRFASYLARKLAEEYAGLEIGVITSGTPVAERPFGMRPSSFLNYLLSLSYRWWPEIKQPQLDLFQALVSREDTVVDIFHATWGSKATIVELSGFKHGDYIIPEKIIPVLNRILTK